MSILHRNGAVMCSLLHAVQSSMLWSSPAQPRRHGLMGVNPRLFFGAATGQAPIAWISTTDHWDTHHRPCQCDPRHSRISAMLLHSSPVNGECPRRAVTILLLLA